MTMDVVTMTPERSTEQRMDALAWANEIRKFRAQLKRDVKAGKVPVVSVLLEELPAAQQGMVETMKVIDLLLVVPKVGRVKANRWLRDCLVSPSRTVGGMSDRQRMALVATLSGRRP
jgi:hypothetical protein